MFTFFSPLVFTENFLIKTFSVSLLFDSHKKPLVDGDTAVREKLSLPKKKKKTFGWDRGELIHCVEMKILY
jgi:hypothetical protein